MNCIIIEDERNASERLKKLISTHLEYLSVDGIFSSVKESIEYLRKEEPPSLIFMDINLSDGSAFSIFDQIKVSSPVIFITAHNEFALKAYKTSAIDYLLKPVKKDELLNAVGRLSRHRSNTIKFSGLVDKEELTYVVRYGNRYYITKVADISFIQEKENLTILSRKDKLQFPINIKISDLVKELPKFKFAQISRHMIINIDAISNLEYKSKIPYLELESMEASKIKVEKEFAQSFNEWLHQQYA